MKFLKFGFLATIFAMALLVTACGGGDHTHDGDEGHEHHDDGGEDGHDDHSSDADSLTIDLESKEYASAYICPMHCEGSGSDESGKCPVCEMDYVPNEEHNGEKHEH